MLAFRPRQDIPVPLTNDTFEIFDADQLCQRGTDHYIRPSGDPYPSHHPAYGNKHLYLFSNRELRQICNCINAYMTQNKYNTSKMHCILAAIEPPYVQEGLAFRNTLRAQLTSLPRTDLEIRRVLQHRFTGLRTYMNDGIRAWVLTCCSEELKRRDYEGICRLLMAVQDAEEDLEVLGFKRARAMSMNPQDVEEYMERRTVWMGYDPPGLVYEMWMSLRPPCLVPGSVGRWSGP